MLPGDESDQLNTFALPASIASAIVSPKARPNPSTRAPKMPPEAVGSVTRKMTSQRVAPRP